MSFLNPNMRSEMKHFVRLSVLNANIRGEMKWNVVYLSCIDSSIGGPSCLDPNKTGEMMFVCLS